MSIQDGEPLGGLGGPSGREAQLESALQDALEGLRDMLPYVDEYFRKKWDHQGYIDRAEKALEARSARPSSGGPAPFEPRVQTHSASCWSWHPECAQRRIGGLLAWLEKSETQIEAGGGPTATAVCKHARRILGGMR
jgi:hypothetical protein